MSVVSREHVSLVADALVEGNVVPFLGAGVNLWHHTKTRGEDGGPARGQGAAADAAPRLPSGPELAERLAPREWPEAKRSDLLRASQYVDLMQGSGPLYRKLRQVFNRDYPTTPLHDLLARVPAIVRQRSPGVPAPLLVTTNYDYVLESAFLAAGEEFDQVTYIADGADAGLFQHRKWRKPVNDAAPVPVASIVIRIPSEYNDEDLRSWQRPVLLKIHGAVDILAEAGDSYVITEDHYIDYLARTDSSNFLPAVIGTRLKNSHILFLAYGLRDWNLRVVLRRIWGQRRLTWISWAVQHEYEEIDRRFWARHDVELIGADLGLYVEALGREIAARTPHSGTTT